MFYSILFICACDIPTWDVETPAVWRTIQVAKKVELLHLDFHGNSNFQLKFNKNPEITFPLVSPKV